MINTDKEVALQTILEALSLEMLEEDKRVRNWGKGISLCISSLSECTDYVYAMMNTASFNGSCIRFDLDGSTVETVPAFNYLLVTNEYIWSELINGASIIYPPKSGCSKANKASFTS